MSEISLLASRHEFTLLMDYADYMDQGDPYDLHLENGDILYEGDAGLLWGVLYRQEFAFPKKGLGVIRIPDTHRVAFEVLRSSLTTQGVGVRPSKLTGTSLVQRMAEALLLAGRVKVDN